MPIPPCLMRLERYRWVKFGFCSTGSHAPNIVIDGKGNVRSCNLSSGVLGNIGPYTGLDIVVQLAGLALSIWALVELGFLRGTSGRNRYGPDPLASAKVRVQR